MDVARAAAALLGALALVGGLAMPAAAQQSTSGGQISGQVRDDTGAVAPGTCVRTQPSNGSYSADPAMYRSATADASGRYAVSVPAGSYALTVGSCTSGGPYATVFRGGSDRAADSPSVAVQEAATAAVDLVTPRSATLSGRVVYDDDGSPAARKCLSVQGSANPDILLRVLTADDGTYTVPGVAAGPRRVHFGDCEGSGASYGSWYDGGRAYDEATPIEVVAGGAVTGIDGTLRRYATMTGRVVDETGAPVVGACAQLQSASGGGFTGFGDCTDADGRWSVEQLRPSAYKVFISRGIPQNADLVERYYPASPSSSNAVPVVVFEGIDVPSVDVVLPHGGRISGRVTSVDGTPLVGACVDARGLSSNSTTTTSDGTYLIRGIDLGAYHVHVRRCGAGNWAPSWYGTTQDRYPTTEGLQISLGEEISGIDVALEPGAVVTGRVVDSAGVPLAGICTTAYYGAGVQEDARTDAQGRYVLQGLPTARDYYLIWRDCIAGRYAQEYSGGSAFEATATRLVTTSGQTTQVPDAVLELAGSVSGTVTDARTGLRVGRVGVTVVDPETGMSAVYGFTDGNGTYTVRGVKPGRWAVRFYDGGANVAVQEYWDDSLSLVHATPIDVVEGTDRAGVDAAVLLLTVPSVPRLPQILPAPEAAVVTWDPPLDDGSAAIERYDVVDPVGTVVATVPGTVEEARVEGLTAGRTYAFAVRAANRKGPGPATDPLEVTPQVAGSSSSPSPEPPSPSSSPSPSSPSGPSPSSPSPGSPSPSSAPEAAGGQPFAPLTPARVLDTRDGTGGLSGRLAPGLPATLRVTGRGGVPPSGVRAVVLNTTVTGASASGHLTVYPGGTVAPTASNLNFTRGLTVPNLVTVPVAADGTVRLVANAGSPHVLADVVGWYGPAAALRFGALAPERVLDTRDGTGGVAGRLAPGQAVRTVLAGRAGVPAEGARAVVLNVTVTGASGSGHLTAYPGGTAPLASNLNYVRGQTVPNLVVVPLARDGSVSLRTNAGSPHVIADVVGWFGLGSVAGDLFTGLRPARLLDTRQAPDGRLLPGESRALAVLGRGGVPAAGVHAVVLNVTATGASATGHLSVHPDAPPLASSLNFVRSQTVANLVVVPIAPDGTVRFTSNAGGPHVVVDVVGWYGG